MRTTIGEGRVLLVDDDPRMRRSLRDLLEVYDCTPDEAGSGREAIEKLRATHYDVVLLDLNMPEIDGHAVMDFLAEHEINTLVIVVSGESSFDALSNALRRGAYDYIKKPYAPEELVATVKNALKKRHLESDNEVMQARLRRSEQLHRFIVNNSPDIIFVLDDCGYITYINRRLESLLNIVPDQLIGHHFSELTEPEDEQRAQRFLRRVLVNGEQTASVELALRNNGLHSSKRYFDVTVSPATNPEHGIPVVGDGELVIYGTARDITDRKETEAFINFQAYHDLLTRLPNRVLFKDRLSMALSQAKRHDHLFAVMFLDLDRFKTVNDSLGHSLGDRLLQAVAVRLQEFMRAGDTLSRFGGDEFTLLFPEIESRESVMAIAQKIIEVLKQPFNVEGHEIYIGCSIGIAIYPDAGTDMEILIQNADIAMYNVKGSGKDSFCVYSSEMSNQPAFRLTLERDLRRALANNEFELAFQPQLNARTGKVVGLETLVRWQHPDRGLMYPSEFVPVAEEIRLIHEIDQWVLREVCEALKRMQRIGFEDIVVAVNLSPLLIEQHDFVDRVLAIVRDSRVAPQCLELEITENVLLKDVENIADKFRVLAQAGFRIALDDFGTGYSSLNYLHRFPIDTLKIDQSFVRNIRKSGDEACIVDAIVAMAQGLRLHIVAEGVETREQMDYLLNLGCEDMQGWLFSRALPETDLRPGVEQRMAMRL